MADYYTHLVSRFIFPLQEHLKGHSTMRVMREMEQSQWWSRQQLESYQVQRLQELLREAGRHVSYYRNLFRDIGFNPDKIASVSDLGGLPFLTKEIIRANLERLKADHAIGLARFNTGGSSGQPLIFFIGNQRVSHDVAAKWRATRWWGVDIGDPEIVVWGSPIELGAQDRVRVWRDKIMRTRLLPAFEMSESRLDEFIAIIRERRPRMLFGYPSSLAHIARHAKRRRVQLNDLGIKVAFVTSERLYDDQRQIIEQVFGCPAANGYGGRDAGFIAHQCSHGGMHITAEDIIVEIVDMQGRVLPPGQAGEVVITHLATGDFPFIRYRTGDIAELDDRQCACGRGLPMLKEIQGRTTDFIMARDGTVMHGLALIYVVRDIPGIETFKIVQESLEYCHVYVTVNGEFLQGRLEDIRRGFAARLGDGVRVDIDIVDSIPKEASGKFRYVVSKLVV
ncbi:MAG: phenylacetate--CoA ligase family protein [Gammaproteobacteria bacterium]|nr:phenylacetate--CoA ligase family protein [Gammaproteobacteria bacterium]